MVVAIFVNTGSEFILLFIPNPRPSQSPSRRHHQGVQLVS